jgi:predicted dehydrogenase
MVGDMESCTAYSGRQSGRQDIEFDDTTIVNCKFYNGTLGSMHFTINSYGKNMEGSITLFTEKGTIKIGGQYLNELEYQSVEEGLAIVDLPEGNPANNYGEYQGSMSNHDEVYKNVREVLTGNGVIATNGYEGLKTVEIISDIQRAVQKT